MAEHSIKNTLETVAGYIGEEVKDVLDEKEDIFRVDTMPVASADYVGKIVQFTGTTNANYTNGYFYKCVAHEEESGGETITTYAWEQTNVQPGGDARVKSEILEFGVKPDTNGFRPYCVVDPTKVILGFEAMSWGMIKIYADLYYAGKITLAQIQEAWSIGDHKTLALPASDRTAAQNVEVYIIDFDHDTLTTASGGKTKALMTLGFMMDENLAVATEPYSTSELRTWLDEDLFELLPQDIQDMTKQVVKSVDGGFADDYQPIETLVDSNVFIPSSFEFIGRGITGAECNMSVQWREFGTSGGGTKYAYYNTANVRSKNVVTCSLVRVGDSSRVNWQVFSTPANGDTRGDIGTAGGIMPHFCV